jgi:hypothetical protein
MRACVVWLALVLCLAGCAPRVRPNADCRWPDEEILGQLDLASSRDLKHLSDDAFTAEDLAIRHADARRGHRSSGAFKDISEYRQTRDSCMAALFDAIARQHGVSTAEVRGGLGNRRIMWDALVMLSFGAIYIVSASVVVRRVLRSALGDQPWLAIAAIVAASIGLSVIGVALGFVWSGLLEAIQVGNGHLSYRVERIPFRRYGREMFLLGVLLFLMMAAWRWRSGGNFSRS